MVAENGLGEDRCLHTSGLGSLATGVHRAGLAPREPGMSRVERSGRRWAASASGSHFYVRAEASPWYTASGPCIDAARDCPRSAAEQWGSWTVTARRRRRGSRGGSP